MASRSTVPPSTTRADAPSAAKAARGEQLLSRSNLATARVLSTGSCSCVRSPRAIAHWLLRHAEPSVEPTELALDREEASLWSHALTGRLRIEHTAVGGECAIHLGYRDGRSITIGMDELRHAAVAAIA